MSSRSVSGTPTRTGRPSVSRSGTCSGWSWVRRPGRQGARDLGGAVLGHVAGDQALREPHELRDRLAAHVGHDQRLILVVARPLGHLDERRRRVLAELRVDGTERGVCVEQDLVGRECDQRAAAHRVVRDDGGHRPVVVGERRRDLACRDHHAAGRVEDDLDRPSGRRLVDGPQHALGVVDVDVADDREAEQRHLLLAVDQCDHRRLALARQDGQRPPPLQQHLLPLYRGLERGEDEEQPEEAERIHLDQAPRSEAAGDDPHAPAASCSLPKAPCSIWRTRSALMPSVEPSSRRVCSGPSSP